MKRSASPRPSAAAARVARVAAVIANAKSRGEKVPRGVKLLSAEQLSDRAEARAQKHAQTLVSTARRVLARRAKQAA